MSINLRGMSATDLKALIASAEDQLVKGERERIRTVREQILQLLKVEGLSLEQVFGGKRGPAARHAVAPKYMNPADPTQTWAGRGKPPTWFKTALESGKTREQLLVAPSQPVATTPAPKSARLGSRTRVAKQTTTKPAAKKPASRKTAKAKSGTR